VEVKDAAIEVFLLIGVRLEILDESVGQRHRWYLLSQRMRIPRILPTKYPDVKLS
jgi:hypothetical protein